MRYPLAALLLLPGFLHAQKSGADTGVESILQVRRIYVSPLIGGAQASALRELIIDSLSTTKLFVLTENPDRADAVLKGAADDHTFTDTFDSNDGSSSHQTVTKNNGASSLYSRASGLSVADGGSLDDSHHIKERKHEAYATVRLCNKDGDVIWSTTQESLGAKFKGASADVAARIAHQITLDYERERREAQTGGTATAAATPSVSVKQP
jgi:hypothetical protein